MKRPGLTLEVIGFDEHLIELRISAESARFRGMVNVYCGKGDLDDIAQSIEGFPASKEDRRQFSLGGFGPRFAYGAVSVELVVRDHAGHCGAFVQLEGDHDECNPAESAVLKFRIEPSDIDRFVAALRRINRDRTGIATLQAHE